MSNDRTKKLTLIDCRTIKWLRADGGEYTGEPIHYGYAIKV